MLVQGPAYSNRVHPGLNHALAAYESCRGQRVVCEVQFGEVAPKDSQSAVISYQGCKYAADIDRGVCLGQEAQMDVVSLVLGVHANLGAAEIVGVVCLFESGKDCISRDLSTDVEPAFDGIKLSSLETIAHADMATPNAPMLIADIRNERRVEIDKPRQIRLHACRWRLEVFRVCQRRRLRTSLHLPLAGSRLPTGLEFLCTRSYRIARLADELRLPDLKDNLETRLLLLRRRLEEKAAPIRLRQTGRGKLRLELAGPALLESR